MRSCSANARSLLGAAAWIGACAVFSFAASSAAPSLNEISLEDTGYPESSRYFILELSDMRATLAAAPLESFEAPIPGLELTLPLPDGTSERFAVWESSIMHPDLAAQYPEIKTYVGRGLDDPTATARFDTTPAGFHALILSSRRTMLIDPLSRGDNRTYVSYFKRSAVQRDPEMSFSCELEASPERYQEMGELAARQRGNNTTGPELRVYRTAIAATGEYTQFHGGSVALGLAAINTSLNRVTGIYERELSIRMVLIPNNNLIVYTNPGSDPYSNANGGAMLGQNQSNLDSVIGSANYDIGHVFSTGGGGVAGLSVVCRLNQKARGVTGLNQPQGDVFDVDFVSHEMGHQYGATHTFNGNAGSCSGNRTASTAYEPGSGSTIMGYAGICGSQNIANSSQDEFHGASFDQITNYTQNGIGSTCPTIIATGNSPPTAVAGNIGHTIPIETTFILFGTPGDPDGDATTHSWEEFDLGPAGAPNSPVGQAPIFRSFPPRDRIWRMFPRRVDVINNTSTFGELLPTYGRRLNYRFTVRDNLGGVAYDATVLDVEATAGPFLVTSTDATPWTGGEMKTITWDVANTDLPPVSCATVNIVLSINGGTDFTETLVAATPNDGSEVIMVPNLSTNDARVQVEAADNVFFDMNDSDFQILEGAVGVDIVASVDPLSLDVRPNPFTSRTSVSFALANPGQVDVRVFDTAGRLVTTLVDGTREAGRHSVEWDGNDANRVPVAAGVYFVRMESQEAARTTRTILLR